MAALKPRGLAITGDGRKALEYCDGRYPVPCAEAWPASRFAWCPQCSGVDRDGERSVG